MSTAGDEGASPSHPAADGAPDGGPGRRMVTGSIVFGGAAEVPPDATLTVQLLDVSVADAPSVTLAEQVIDGPGQRSVPFALPYDPGVIDSRHSYTVSARASRGDELLYVSTTHNAVLTGGAPDRVDVVLAPVTGPPS